MPDSIERGVQGETDGRISRSFGEANSSEDIVWIHASTRGRAQRDHGRQFDSVERARRLERAGVKGTEPPNVRARGVEHRAPLRMCEDVRRTTSESALPEAVKQERRQLAP